MGSSWFCWTALKRRREGKLASKEFNDSEEEDDGENKDQSKTYMMMRLTIERNKKAKFSN